MMDKISRPSALASLAFKAGIGPVLILGLTGCEGLARLTAKPDSNPTTVAVAAETPSPPPVVAEEPRPKEPDKPLKGPLYEWKGAGQPITRIVINTDEQKARFYSGETEIGWSTVATGVPKYPTPIGQFRVTEKIENKRSNLYGKIYGQGGRVIHANAKMGRDPIPEGARFEGAHMPFYLRLTGDGIGLHAGPIPKPGRPASHGCIRMPTQIAPVVFGHVTTGTPVIIEGKGPTYSEYIAKQRAEAARLAAANPPKTTTPRPSEGAQSSPGSAKPEAAPSTPAAQTQPAEAPAPGPELAASAQAPAAAPAPAPAATGEQTAGSESSAAPQAAAAEGQAPATGSPPKAPETAAPAEAQAAPPKPPEAAPAAAPTQVPATPQQPAEPAAPKQESAPAAPAPPPQAAAAPA